MMLPCLQTRVRVHRMGSTKQTETGGDCLRRPRHFYHHNVSYATRVGLVVKAESRSG